MKINYKIIIIMLVCSVMLLACADDGSKASKTESSNDVNQSENVSDEKTQNESQSNSDVDKTSSGTSKLDEKVKIKVNFLFGGFGVGDVNKQELIDYINNSSNHDFIYEYAKESIDIVVDETEDYMTNYYNRDTGVPNSINYFPTYDGFEDALKNTSFHIQENDGEETTYTLTSEKSDKKVIISDLELTGRYIVGKEIGNYYNTVYDEELNKIFDDRILTFEHLGDDYYQLSDILSLMDLGSEPDDSFMLENRYINDFTISAIYNPNLSITEHRYFITRYLGNDIFYVSDINGPFFMNMRTQKKMYEFVNKDFIINEFAVYDGLIIGDAQDESQIYITDKNYMLMQQYYEFDNCKIRTGIASDGVRINSYPVFEMEDKKVEKRINERILLEFFGENGIDSLEADYNETKLYLISVEDSDFEIMKNGAYVTVSEGDYADFFGAHPLYSTSYHVFDISTGDYVNLSSLFKDVQSAQEAILSNIVELARKDYEDEIQLIYPDIIDDLEFSDDILNTAKEIFLIDGLDGANYSFNNEGLEIMYNPYEIAPYAFGNFYYTIPYDKLKPYFKFDVIDKLGI